jgi:hypothetical protein
LKNANPARQEHARLEVENAEDDLVQKTEVAITLMKTVLENVGLFIRIQKDISDNPIYRSCIPSFRLLTKINALNHNAYGHLCPIQPEPIKNLNELIKAQLLYFSIAAESLSAVQGEIEELSVAAEGEYRWVIHFLVHSFPMGFLLLFHFCFCSSRFPTIALSDPETDFIRLT